MKIPRPSVIALLIIVPAALRALQVGWNVVPIGALALFCGAHFRNRSLAFAIPIGSMVLGDVLLGLFNGDAGFYTFHGLVPVVYGCYAISVAMGIGLQRYWDRVEKAEGRPSAQSVDERAPARRSLFATRVLPIATTTMAGAVLFFFATNFGDWYVFDTYTKDWHGLIDCYAAGIPFFRYTLGGDLIGSAILFGGEYLVGLNLARAAQSERF
jgi:hypothetical protein